MEQVLQVRWKLPSPPAKACMLRNLAYVRLALVSCFDCTGVYDEQYSMAVLFYMNVHPSFCKLLSLSTELDCPSFLEPPYRVSPCEHSSVSVFPAWRPFRLFSFRWYFTQCCSFVEYIHVGSAFLGTAKLLCKVAVEIYTLASSAWAFLLAFIFCLGFVTRFEFCSSRSSLGVFTFISRVVGGVEHVLGWGGWPSIQVSSYLHCLPHPLIFLHRLVCLLL